MPSDGTIGVSGANHATSARGGWVERLALFLVLVLLVLLTILYRPQMQVGDQPALFILVTFFWSGLLAFFQCRFLRSWRPLAFKPWLILLAFFNIAYLLSQKHPWFASSDTMMALHAARHYLDGLVAFPNFWFLPDLADFSRDVTLWNYWWSPLTVWLPLPLLGLFEFPHHGVHLLIYLTVLAGYLGWLRVATQMQLPTWMIYLFSIFLVGHAVFEQMLVNYVGDIFPYAASPWALWLVLKITDSFRKKPEDVSLTATGATAFICGLLYLVKFSSVFSGMGYVGLLAFWLIFQGPNRDWVSRLKRVAVLGVAFSLPILATMQTSVWFTGIANVSNQWRASPDYFVYANLEKLRQVLLMPADLLVATGHVPSPQGTAWFWFYAAVLYLAAVVGGGVLGLPLAVFFFCGVTIPSLGLLYATIQAAQDAMFIGRYRFPFAPLVFLILLMPSSKLSFQRPKGWREYVHWSGLLLAVGASAIPAALALGAYVGQTTSAELVPLWRRNRPQRISQSVMITDSSRAVAAIWNRHRGPSSLLAAAFDDGNLQNLSLLQGRVMAVYMDSASLNAVMRPEYVRSGAPLDGSHRWRTSKPMDLFLLISFPQSHAPEVMDRFLGRFPQVRSWETLFKDSQFLMLRGKPVLEVRR